MERRIRVGYDGARYDLPALKWTQSSFMQPQMMVQDRYFYDPVAGKYTVDRYLDDLEKRYGGIDAVLIWPTYPNMGIDNRNPVSYTHLFPVPSTVLPFINETVSPFGGAPSLELTTAVKVTVCPSADGFGLEVRVVVVGTVVGHLPRMQTTSRL